MNNNNEDRYNVIKEIAEKNNMKRTLKSKIIKAGAALKRKQKHEMSEKDIDNLAAYADHDTHNVYDSSFDGSKDHLELREEVTIMNAYEEGKGE